MEANRNGFESQVLGYIKDAEREYQELEDRQAQLNSQMAAVKETLDTLRKALQFHRARTGKIEREEEPKLSGVKTLREACHILLQQYGDMDKQQLKDTLEHEGFQFATKRPISAIHFALVNDGYITITEEGSYQWIGNKVQRPPVLTLPKATIRFFVKRSNAPASIPEVLDGIKKLGVRTTAKDLHDALEMELMYSDKTERVKEGKYHLKQDVFEANK
ncbi:MAG: hypothetical protein E3J66_00310 [Dehalococcoidia bacterium]|nr:MAG: hypothetical protein E3J66_00310 [Dehalococcoidia bacterium]